MSMEMVLSSVENLAQEVDGTQPALLAETSGAGEVENGPRILREVIDAGALDAPPPFETP